MNDYVNLEDHGANRDSEKQNAQTNRGCTISCMEMYVQLPKVGQNRKNFKT